MEYRYWSFSNEIPKSDKPWQHCRLIPESHNCVCLLWHTISSLVVGFNIRKMVLFICLNQYDNRYQIKKNARPKHFVFENFEAIFFELWLEWIRCWVIKIIALDSQPSTEGPAQLLRSAKLIRVGSWIDFMVFDFHACKLHCWLWQKLYRWT